LAKFAVIVVWAAGLAVEAFVLGIAVSALVGIPGWSDALAWQAAANAAAVVGLTLAMMPMVALFAGIGRGYLAPMGWMFLTMAFGQLAVGLGWGSWFPWSVALLFGAGGARAAEVGTHSVLVVALVCAAGLVATLAWWRYADQTR
jgi:ABC-2 type transport system permease protein